jgi:hypothetical protein
MTTLGMGAQLSGAQLAQPTILAAMTDAAKDAGPAIAGIPGAAEFMSAAMAYAGRLSTAVTEVGSAVSVANALTAGGSPIDEAKLKSGIANLRGALPMKEIINHLEKFFTNPTVSAKLKQRYGGESKNVDFAAVRQALKKVQPSTVVAFKELNESLTKLQAYDEVVDVGSLKASLGQMKSDLGGILADFGKDIERLVKVCDTWVATFE